MDKNFVEYTKIYEFAEQNGYEDIDYIGEWQEYQVFDLIKNPNGYSCVGFPLVALVKNGEIRISTEEESLEILDYFYPNDTDEQLKMVATNTKEEDTEKINNEKIFIDCLAEAAKEVLQKHNK